MQPRQVIIDCDTGVDDAMALLLALRAPGFDVVGITCVGGNVPLPKVVRNTLVIAEHAERDVPVYAGASRPLLAPPVTAEYAHGSDGLGDVGFPDPKGRPAAEHAVDYLVRMFMECAKPPLLVTLAPLTNIALALLREPRLEERIPHIVMMAGGITGGNTTPAAEFNVYVDPEAADIVFRSRIPKTMVSLEPIWEGAKLDAADAARIEASDSPWCQAFARLLRRNLLAWERTLGKPHPARPCDLAAMAVALQPDLATVERRRVVIETQGKHTRGMTLVDTRHYRFGDDVPEPNTNVVMAIDSLRFRTLVLRTLIGIDA